MSQLVTSKTEGLVCRSIKKSLLTVLEAQDRNVQITNFVDISRTDFAHQRHGQRSRQRPATPSWTSSSWSASARVFPSHDDGSHSGNADGPRHDAFSRPTWYDAASTSWSSWIPNATAGSLAEDDSSRIAGQASLTG